MGDYSGQDGHFGKPGSTYLFLEVSATEAKAIHILCDYFTTELQPKALAFLRQDLGMHTTLTWDLQSSCLCLPAIGIVVEQPS